MVWVSTALILKDQALKPRAVKSQISLVQEPKEDKQLNGFTGKIPLFK